MDNNDDTLGVCTKEEFIEWVTEGFPIDIHKVDEARLLSLFANYINDSDNEFEAQFMEGDDENEYYTSIIIYGLPLALVKYNSEKKKIIIVTSINENNSDTYSRGFNEYEIKKYLGDACLGVIVFFKNFKLLSGTLGLPNGFKGDKYLSESNVKFDFLSNEKHINKVPVISNDKSIFSKNIKYDAWPLK